MIWHNHHADEVLRELRTDATNGLSETDAAARLEEYGENRLQEKAPLTLFQRFLRQMKDAMVIILLIAAAISLALAMYDHFVQGKPFE